MIGLIEQHLRHRPPSSSTTSSRTAAATSSSSFAAELPLQAIAEIMGVPQEDRHLLFEWSNRMIGSDDPEYAAPRRHGLGVHRALHVRQRARCAAPGRSARRHRHQAHQRRDRRRQAEPARVRDVHAAADRGRQRDDAKHHRPGMLALMQQPRAVQALRGRPRAAADSAVEEILRWASPGAALPAYRDGRHRDPRPGDRARRQGRHVAHLGQPRRERLRRPLHVRHLPRSRTSRWPSAAAARTSAWAPTSPAWSCASLPRADRAHPRHADWRPSPTSCARTSSAASSTCRSTSPRASGGSQRPDGQARGCRQRPRATSSAICNVFSAAPLRRLSPQTKSSSWRGSSSPCRIRPT